MSIKEISQPKFIYIEDNLRLINNNIRDKEIALPWYQNEKILYFSEGIKGKKYDFNTIKKMYDYLDSIGELYFIEIYENKWKTIGDVTLSEENMPIVIGNEKYWGMGIGKKVITALLKRAKVIGLNTINIPSIYTYNERSKGLFKSLGFKKVSGKKESYSLDLSNVNLKMTEKEKMLSGMGYNSMVDELINDRLRAKTLCKRFNDTKPNEIKERKLILSELFSKANDCFIEPNFFCDYGYNIEIGENFFANHNCVILDVNKVIIGKNVMVGPNVQIYTATHPLDVNERLKGIEMGYPVRIADNVWIGGGVIICPGVTIGKNTTIGAGSVVTKDIPENVLASGNPCRVIKRI